ncbi:TonB-dependent siderophore receptor [Paenochrobactrum glaciei]|uniref:Heme transporter BhuA n=1 Tax=Paenochrobactrum glaciei TaxID=486407 RepID=A0ABP3RN05_9HYPH
MSSKGIVRRVFVSALWMSTALATITIALPAKAQEFAAPALNSENKDFNIRPQSLQNALTLFGQQAGIQVSVDAAALRGLSSAGVSGSLTPNAAIGRLLSGTGLNYHFGSPKTILITKAGTQGENISADGSILLQTITVQAQGGATTEGTNSYTTRSMATALKLPMSIRETPQSVSVVTRKMIDDKDYLTLDQALADTPGITTKIGASSVRHEYWSRGLEIDNIQYDGVSNNVHYFARDSDGQDDMDMYDRVEVIKGAAGLTTGAGNPSGAINLIRKRPLDEEKATITTRASSWGNGRGVIDYSRPLNEEKTVRARIVGAFGAGDSYKDYYSNRDGLFYGTIDADLTEDTTLNIGYSYQDQKIDGFDWGGLPARPDGSFYNFSSSTFLGHEWDYLNRRQNTLFLDLEHRFDNGWKLNVDGRAAWSRADMRGGYTWWIGDNLWFYPGRFPYENDVYSFDVNTSGPVELFGREHDFVFGVNASRTKLSVGVSNYDAWIMDPTNWDPSADPEPDAIALTSGSEEKTDQLGAYASARFSLTDDLKLITGGRISWWKWDQEMTTYKTGATTYSDYSANANFVPYVGLVYDVASDLTVYASYTGIFKPQNYYGRDGHLLDPIKGTNLEAGVKADFLDGQLSATAAVFRTKRDNVGQKIIGISYCNPLASSCYEGVDGVETKGIELEMRGAITDRWNMMAGYTYAVSKYTEGSLDGQRFNTTQAPEHVFKLYTSYSFPDEHWTIAGGVRAQSKIYSKTQTVDLKQGAFVVADVMAKYDLTEKTAIQFNVNNIFDKRYYTSIDPTVGLNNWMGAPREFRLNLKHTF